MTTYSKRELEELTVQQLRDLARQELGPDSFAALARKNELIKALLAGAWPEKAFGPRREARRDPEAERLAAALARFTKDHPEFQISREQNVEDIRTIIQNEMMRMGVAPVDAGVQGTSLNERLAADGYSMRDAVAVLQTLIDHITQDL